MTDQGRVAGCRFKKRAAWFSLCLWFSLFLMLGRPVEAPAADIAVEEIKAAVARYVENNMPWPEGTLKLDFPARLRNVALPGGPVTLVVQSRTGEDYIGDTTFTVRFYTGANLLREERMRARLTVLRDFAVAVRALARDEEIEAGDIKVLKKWVRRIPANAVSTLEEAIGKAAAFNIRQDSEITRNMLKPLLLVKRGSVVRIVLDDGRLNIMTVGVSAEDGVADSIVKVRNLSSNKTIYARVAGASLVNVDF